MSTPSKKFGFWRGMGSAVDIWPAGDYSDLMPRGTAQQRLGAHWQRTGNHLRKALSTYERRLSSH